MANKRVSVYRREHFNAAHRLNNPAWDAEKNFTVFGKCSNPNFHGHNYEMEVRITGETDPETGFVINLKDLRDIIQERILEKLDHKNLNLDVPEFKGVNPTVENIVVFIFEALREKIDPKFDLHIRLYETPRNFAEYPAA